MSQEKLAALYSPLIGDGNPLAILTAQEHLQRADIRSHAKLARNPLTTLASWKQAQTTANEAKRKEYNQNYEQIRGSLAASLLGLVNLLQLSAFLQQTKSTDLILAQESPLLAMQKFNLPAVSAFIHGLRQISILVPDVYPKPGAITVAKQQPNVQLLVWNQSAYQKLHQQSINAQLIAPWLMSPDWQLGPKSQLSLVRPSGTGVNQAYLRALPRFLQSINSPTNKIEVYDKKKTKSIVELYRQIVLANPEIIFSYPSEMIQFLVQLYLAGYAGEHCSFPHRGKHEELNLTFAKAFGISRGLNFDGQNLSYQRRRSGRARQAKIEQLNAEVGHKKLSTVI